MKEIIIVKENNNQMKILLCENGKLIEYYEEGEESNRIEGNIYLGRVKNILPGMQAAFVDIGEDKNAFIHLKDILPKMDEKVDKEEIDKQRNISIHTHIKQEQTLLVQVKRDAANKKGARLSTHINLGNRFIALLPNTPFITISQKIESEDERIRLKAIVEKYLPHGFGAIIRTAAIGKEEKEIKQDIEEVLSIWEEIEGKVKDSKIVPQKVYEQRRMLEKFLIDILDQGIDRILVNEESLQQEVEAILEKMEKKKLIILEKMDNLLDLYKLTTQIEKRKERKIWLKCGGFINIDITEALVAIDVNSGKYTGNKNLQKTVLKVNKEASIEIAKQLRLRDIGGIIIIDYIDMDKEEDRQEVMKTLQDKLKEDRSKTQIVGFTKLNLLEMTRKHIYS